MRRRKHILGLGLLLVAVTSIPAFAQPTSQGYPPCTKTVSTSESELAHQKYIAGKQDYDEGNYDSALRRFRDAYNLDCTKHELLIIISAAYERKGDKKEAVSALETYVNRSPSAPDVGTYQAKIENLKKQIAAPPPPTATTTTAPNGTSNPPSGDVQEHTAYPWIVVGVGAAAVVAGVVVLVTTPSLPEGCSADTETCTPLTGEDPPKAGSATPATSKQLADADKLHKRQEEAGKIFAQPKFGYAFMIGGGVLIAGGLVWHFLEPIGPKETTGKTKLRPAVAPGYAGLSLGGTF